MAKPRIFYNFCSNFHITSTDEFAKKAFTKNSSIFISNFAILHIFIFVLAQTLIVNPIDIYTDINRQKTIRLTLKLFV